MKKSIKYTAVMLACMIFTAVTGCEGKTDTSDNIIVATTETPQTTAVAEEVTTSVAEEITTDISTEQVTESNTDTVPQSNNGEYKTVLNSYHNAYLANDANAVYALFCPAEITAFDAYMKNYLKTELGEDDETLEKIFTKQSVLESIDKSVKNIHEIMDSYGESPDDTWSINIDENTIEHYSEDEIAEINSKLGINVTDGYICEIPFYKNNVNDEVFVAEPASVLMIDGKWYISYSAAFDRLIDFMDIEF